MKARAWYVKATRRDRSWRYVAGPFDDHGEGYAELARIRPRYPDAAVLDVVLHVGKDLPEPTPRGPLDVPLPPDDSTLWPRLNASVGDAAQVGYYVTARRSAKRIAWLAGPFPTHEEALRHVEAARIVACCIDPWCDFDAFGTTRLERATALPPGILHALVGF